MSDFYRVQLDAFEGPMDLLLYLIRKHEVDLHDIPMSIITDQYLGFLDELDTIDIDLAGEFLLTAATLMELKSRMLAASTETSEDSAGESPVDPVADPRAELVAQLLAYKKYRDAAKLLSDRKEDWERRSPVHSATIDDESVRRAMDEMGELEIEDLDLSDLVSAFRVIVESVDFARIGEHQVMSDDTPIEVYANDIVDILTTTASKSNPTTLRDLVTNKPRQQMVGMFLALLVLVRDQRVLINMDSDEPIIDLNPDYDPATDPSSPDNADPIADFV